MTSTTQAVRRTGGTDRTPNRRRFWQFWQFCGQHS
jgi:hypothetical protein